MEEIVIPKGASHLAVMDHDSLLKAKSLASPCGRCLACSSASQAVDKCASIAYSSRGEAALSFPSPALLTLLGIP